MNLLARIKNTTLAHHQSAEKVLVKELQEITTINDYAFLLQRLYGFYLPIETQLQKVITFELIFDIETRKHVHRIANDITNSDLTPNIKCRNNFEVEDDLSYALGVLYVIEGSTQGGQFISKMVSKKLKLKPNSNKVTSYFESYGDNVSSMWESFKQSISKIEKDIDATKFEQGAKDTFEALENWLISSKNSLGNRAL